MNFCWSSFLYKIQVLLFAVVASRVKSQLQCRARSTQGSCRDSEDICKATSQMQTGECPMVQSFTDKYNGFGLQGCPNEVYFREQSAHPSTSNLNLSLTSVVHSTTLYNLTVSWEHLHFTIPAGSYYRLKLFPTDTSQFLYCICSTNPTKQTTDGLPAWTDDSFDGLVFEHGADYSLVELSIYHPNGSVLIVIATEFNRPRDCLDVVPVSPYGCLSDNDEKRYQEVRNVTSILQVENQVELSWQPSADVTRYMLPVLYYVTVRRSGHEPVTFETNETSIVINPLVPDVEYTVDVQQYVLCSRGCGVNVSRNILTRPTTPETTIPPVYTSSGPGPYSNITTTREMATFVGSLVSVLAVVLGVLTVVVLMVLLMKRYSIRQLLTTTSITRSANQTPPDNPNPHVTIEMSTYGDEYDYHSSDSDDHTSHASSEHDNLSCVSDRTVSFDPEQTVNVVSPIVVMSQRTPENDKHEIQEWLLAQLRKCHSRNGSAIEPVVPGMDKESIRQPAYEWLEAKLTHDRQPCFLCVVNREFKEDWDHGLTSTDTAATCTSNHCLIFPLSQHMSGLANYCNKASAHIMVLHWAEEVPIELVPHGLKVCKTANVRDTKKIAEFIFNQPSIVVS